MLLQKSTLVNHECFLLQPVFLIPTQIVIILNFSLKHVLYVFAKFKKKFYIIISNDEKMKIAGDECLLRTLLPALGSPSYFSVEGDFVLVKFAGIMSNVYLLV